MKQQHLQQHPHQVPAERSHSHDQREDNDLVLPLNPQNKFLSLIVRSKKIDSQTYKPTLVCLIIGSLTFISLSIAIFVSMGKVTTLTIPYSDSCTNSQCSTSFYLPQEMSSPVYVSYQLDDFFQNQRIFIQSKSNQQLSGNVIDQSQAQVCHPFITNEEVGAQRSWGGVLLDPKAIASPCGSIAKAFFNDSFQIVRDENQESITISEEGISWPGDRGGPFKRAINSSVNQWIDPQNEHFINWMRTSGLIDFKKLWGVINEPLLEGNYTLRVQVNREIEGWNGDKLLVLSTSGVFGGQNYTFPTILLVVGIVYVFVFVVMIRKIVALQKMSDSE